jgi:O-antigen/teichoic acid export membrane protein
MRMKALAQGTVVYGLGEVISRSITVLLLPVFTAYLSPSDYGIVSILAAFALFLTPVFSLGLGAAIAPVYFDGNSRARRDATVCTAALILTLSTGVLVLSGVALSSLISLSVLGSRMYSRLVVISIATAAFSIMTIPFRQYLQFEERSRSYAVLSALSILTTSALSVWMVVVLKRGVAGMLEAGLIGQAIGLLLFVAPASVRIRPRRDTGVARELLRISVPLVPAFGCVFLLQHGSKYLLQWLNGLQQVGIYAIGFNLGLVISVVVTAFQGAWIPYFMSFADRPSEARIVYGRVLTYYVLAVGALTLGVFAVARLAILVLTRPAFHSAWQVVGLSATAQFLAGVCMVLLPGMYVAKEVQFIGVLQAIAAVIGLALGIALIPFFGIRGAAASLVISYIALVLVQYAWNRYRRYPEVVYEWRRLVKFVCVYVCYATMALWNRDLAVSQEAAFSAVMVAGLPIVVYIQLDAIERRAVWRWTRTIFEGRPLSLTARV